MILKNYRTRSCFDSRGFSYRLCATASGGPGDLLVANKASSRVPQQLGRSLEEQAQQRSELRKTRLTASVFCHAIGFWKGRRVQLWEEKIGLKEPFQGNLATSWGDLQESAAIDRYKQITENKVSFVLFKSYPLGTDMPDWLGASPDGLVDSISSLAPDKRGILEVKCPFNKGRPDKGFPWPYVPHYYIPQAQGLMEIFDRNWLDFYVWTMNGSCIYRVQRDADLWELMLTALNDFWWGHVVPARHLLAKDIEADVRRYKPSPHHGLYLAILKKCIRLAENSRLILSDVKI